MSLSRRSFIGAAGAAAIVAPVHALAQPLAAPRRFAFGAFGDMPYLPGEEGIVAKLIEDMNAEDLAFVVHVGDVKASWTPCSDALYAERRELFARSRHPIVVLPGDNDWLDCVTRVAGGYDPLDRLALFRKLFHAGDRSLGVRTLALQRQSDEPRFAEYTEHVRWRYGDVLFVGVNVTGSNNNLGYTAQGDAEHALRMAAVDAWLASSFAAAAREALRGVAVFMQANPGLDGKPRPMLRADGFAGIRATLAREVRAWQKPVLLVHGDTHKFRVDQPLLDPVARRAIANLTRVEVFGAPLLGWVKIGVDPQAAALFTVTPLPYRAPEQ
jgi:hypothetical protein